MKRQFQIVHTESSLGWGGQELRVFVELRWMAEHGHRVWLVAPENSRIYQECRQAGIPVYAFGFRRVDWTLGLLQLISFFRSEHIQIVNTHSSRDGWLGGVAARLANVPFIVRSRHIEVEYRNPFLARVAFEYLPHHVLTTSQKIVDRLVREQGINPSRIECLPTGVDMTRFSTRAPGRIQRELGLPEKTPLIGMISVLRSWKGHSDFIDAAKLVLEQSSAAGTHFIIAGEGPGRGDIEKKIASVGLTDRIRLLGFRADVPEVLASLTALVLPSTAHEGVPQIILQAQAMGRPVIGTKVGGIPEVIREGDTGWLVPPKNPAALAVAIARVLQNPEAAQAVGQRALERIRTHHSLDAMGEYLEGLYATHLPKT